MAAVDDDDDDDDDDISQLAIGQPWSLAAVVAIAADRIDQTPLSLPSTICPCHHRYQVLLIPPLMCLILIPSEQTMNVFVIFACFTFVVG